VRDDTCRWPECHNLRWASRGYAICGMHAEFIYNAMKPAESSTRPLERRISQLEAVVQIKEREIQRLQGPKPEPVPPKPAPVHGTVYILRCGGFVKIGWTSDLTKRMRAYQPDTVLLATMPGTRKDEGKLHRKFAHLRTHGREWYPIAPQITEYVAQMVREYGQPDPVTFAAKPVEVPRPHSRPPYIGGNNRGNHQTGVVSTGMIC